MYCTSLYSYILSLREVVRCVQKIDYLEILPDNIFRIDLVWYVVCAASRTKKREDGIMLIVDPCCYL